MTKVCRLCLSRLQRGSKYFNINAVESFTGFMPYRDQLTTCIPEMVCLCYIFDRCFVFIALFDINSIQINVTLLPSFFSYNVLYLKVSSHVFDRLSYYVLRNLYFFLLLILDFYMYLHKINDQNVCYFLGSRSNTESCYLQ